MAADDVFVVAVNDSRRSGGGDFPHVSTAPKVYDEQPEIRQLVIDRASATGVIDPADFADDSWQLVRDGEPLLPWSCPPAAPDRPTGTLRWGGRRSGSVSRGLPFRRCPVVD